MANSSLAQTQRNLNNPLSLGRFETTSLRYLRGSLGPVNEVITNGYGGGTYNNWFKVTLASSAWIITTKVGIASKGQRNIQQNHLKERINFLMVSAYNLNKVPIQGLDIHDEDSITGGSGTSEYFAYLGKVKGDQTDLYNTHHGNRLDTDNETYYPLQAGDYLICISTTLNEPIEYGVGLVVEFPSTEVDFICEDDSKVYISQEDTLGTSYIIPTPVTVNETISAGNTALTTVPVATVQNGVTVTVEEDAIWIIGTKPSDFYKILCDVDEGVIHDHSLSEWKESWEKDHQQDDRFPAFFESLTNQV